MAALGYILAALLVFLVVFLYQYLRGRREYRAIFWQRDDTYVRFYPNPGVGVRLGNRRWAASVVGGLEAYRGRPVPAGQDPAALSGGDRLWIRTWAKGSRVKGKSTAMRQLEETLDAPVRQT